MQKSSTVIYVDMLHAGNLSVLQVRQAITAKYQKNLCAATMGILMIAIAYMIKGYCKLFEKSFVVLNQIAKCHKLLILG